MWLGVALLLGLTALSAQAEDIKFAVIGDYGKGVKDHGVDALVKKWHPDFVITVGDNAYSGDASAHRRSQNAFEVDVIPAFGNFIKEGRFFPSLGNHDLHVNGDGFVPKRLEQYLATLRPPHQPGDQGGGRYYEFVKGPVHFFALHSNKYEPDNIRFSRKQGDWLRDRLAAATEQFKVVFFHHAPYSTGNRHGSNTTMQWPFKEWGASLVLSGHEHNYEHFVRRGLHYVVNGIGGASLYPLRRDATILGLERQKAYPIEGEAGQHGAMLVEVHAAAMTLTLFTMKRLPDGTIDGTQHDQFVIRADRPLPAPVYRDLQQSLQGSDVEAWQDWLFERQLLSEPPDATFGSDTEAATRQFQKEQDLQQTGVVDKATRERAQLLGFKPVEDPTSL